MASGRGVRLGWKLPSPVEGCAERGMARPQVGTGRRSCRDYLAHDPGVRFSLEAAPLPWEGPDPAPSETERDSEIELLSLSAEIEPRLERGASQDRVAERYAQLRSWLQGGDILEVYPPHDVEFERA